MLHIFSDLLKDKSYNNVRIVPIEIEDGHPSTSTPYVNKENRIRTVPVKLIGRQNGSYTPNSKTNSKETVVRAVLIDDDDDDENEVISVYGLI